MDVLGWLGQEVVGHWVGVASAVAGAAALAALRQWLPKAARPALYGLAGGGIIFVCLLLVALSDRHIEELERIGSEQVRELERLTDQQEQSLAELTQATPTRPYFIQSLAQIHELSPGLRYLTVSVQNNSVPAENVVSHLLVLEEALDPNNEPLHTKREEIANPVGSGGILSQHWGAVKIERNTRPAFVVFQVRYTNVLDNEAYSQALYLKFAGSSQDGTFIQQLFNASSDEKSKIERYMEKRGIVTL